MKDMVNTDTAVPEGKISVELFDRHGNRQSISHSNNFISKIMQEHVMKIQTKDIFTGKMASGGTLAGKYPNLLETMYLTDYGGPEDYESDGYVKGNIIGYAYTTDTYSGGDKKRGSYNKAESFVNEDQVRVVIDFPTHAANGTFESIYFSSDIEYEIKSYYGYGKRYSTDGDVREVVKHKGKYYVLYENNYLGVDVLDLSLNKEDNKSLPSDIQEDIRGFCIVGPDAMMAASDGRIYSASLSSLSETSGVTEEADLGSEMDYLNGMDYDSSSGKFYLSENSDSYYVTVTDNNFNILYRYDVESTSGLGYNSKMGVTCIYYKVYALEDNGDVRLRATHYSYDRSVGFDEDLGLIFIDDRDDGKLFTMAAGTIASRSLLDSPVEKTDTSTMKITYDFIF